MAQYRLFNTDCLSLLESWNKQNLKVDCIITDPPYFVVPNGKEKEKFDWDNFEDLETFISFSKHWFELCHNLLKDDRFMFIFWSQKYFRKGVEIFDPARYLFWQHNNLVMAGNGDFAYDYEPLFCIKKGNPKLVKGKHSCLFNYTKPQSNFKEDKLEHPTQKPVKMLEHLISILPEETNKIILDPFMGSGTTGVAALRNNRKFLGIEKELKYFQIAERRLNEELQ